MVKPATKIAVIGDVHGHVQLALTVLARWQDTLGIKFEAVLLCGDVGSFTRDEELDSTTRRHGKTNPCEFEFLRQWSAASQPPWLSYIFKPKGEDGLGLDAPVIMVHGNHDGFSHLKTLAPDHFSEEPVGVEDLPVVDSGGFIRYLPSGGRVRLASGHVVAGVGGIQQGQRHANYHPMAYVDESAVLHLCDGPPSDLLITHQGPSDLQADGGSSNLQVLLDEGAARVWFHGHSVRNPEIRTAGRKRNVQVVPLADIAFPKRGPGSDDPGRRGWCIATLDGERVEVNREDPPFLRDFRRHNWVRMRNGLLMSPALAHLEWRFRDWH